MIPERRRWLILAAGVVANLCQGAAYSSSVFAKPVMTHLKCFKPGTQEPDLTRWALAFSLNVAFLAVGMMLSGKVADRRSPRLAIAAGGVLMGLGMFLTGFSRSLTWLYITFGPVMSIGMGAAYGSCISAAVRWFPDRRGLASGMVVGAVGFGPTIIAPLAQAMISNPTLGIMGAFRVFGIAFFVIVVGASAVITNPPKDYAPIAAAANGISGSGSGLDVGWTDMLRRSRFWALFALYVLGTFSGLMIISQASPMAQKTAALSPAAAAGIVGLLGLANAGGRVFWGSISDRIGRLESLTLMFLVTMAAMFLMPGLAAQKATLAAGFVAVGLCYGGYLGTFPSLCAESFGPSNMAVNYAVLFLAFGIAGLLGPMVGAKLGQGAGGYPQAFAAAGVIALAGLALALGTRFMQGKEPRAEGRVA